MSHSNSCTPQTHPMIDAPRVLGDLCCYSPALRTDEVASGHKRILLVGYSDRWRRLRKAIHNQLQPQAARDFQPIQEQAAQDVVRDILADPDAFQSHIRSYAATIVVSMAYGRTKKG